MDLNWVPTYVKWVHRVGTTFCLYFGFPSLQVHFEEQTLKNTVFINVEFVCIVSALKLFHINIAIIKIGLLILIEYLDKCK